MSHGWNIHDEFRRQVYLCQGIGCHAMMDIVYQQFPAEREATGQKQDDFAELQRKYEALVERIHALPDKWRNAHNFCCDCKIDIERMANELEQALQSAGKSE